MLSCFLAWILLYLQLVRGWQCHSYILHFLTNFLLNGHIFYSFQSKEEGNTNNQRCLAVALRCMEESEDLLQLYFSDFISEKFSVMSVKAGIVVEILQEYFAKLEPRLEKCQGETTDMSPEQLNTVPLPKSAMKVISYHISYHHHKTTLANILPIIKQLDELQHLTTGLKEVSFPRPHFSSYSENALALLGNPASLGAYIIDLLFSIVVHVWMRNEFSMEWFNFYQRMVSTMCEKHASVLIIL